MYRFGRSAIASVKRKGSAISKSQNGPVSDAYLTRFSSSVMEKTAIQSSVHTLSLVGREVAADSSQISKDVFRANGHIVSAQCPLQLMESHRANTLTQSSVRFFASKASEQPKQTSSETKKEISTVEDPFDAPTYNIPEKPVTFAEGASYSLIILAGLGVAAAAAYGVFKELIFEPKEYKIFNKALKRIQDDSQVRVRIGSPITGYGQESRNRAARQRIPNRVYTDEFGIEHVEVNFYIRGPHGAGKVFTEMFKDKEDKQWKFTYLIVEINSPSKAQLMLESYMPAAPTSALA